MPSNCSTFSLCWRPISSELNCASCATNAWLSTGFSGSWKRSCASRIRRKSSWPIPALAGTALPESANAPIASIAMCSLLRLFRTRADIRSQARQRLLVEPLLPRALGIPAGLQLAALAQALHDREILELLDDLCASCLAVRARFLERGLRRREIPALQSRELADLPQRLGTDRLRRRETLASERLRVVETGLHAVACRFLLVGCAGKSNVLSLCGLELRG